jgi:hypothetical protein
MVPALNDAKFRAYLRKVNEAFDRGERDKDTVVGCVSACNFDPLNWGIGVEN